MADRPVKVLLIDDDEDDYVATSDLLSEIDGTQYDLDWAKTYEAGLEAIERGAHDVCLIDYRLGGHDGLELLRNGVRIGYPAPMILLTGLGDREVDVGAMEAGASDYLVKGQIDSTMLERSIRYSMSRSQMEKERIALEQQLLHSQKMEAVGQLAGGIAHDFNNLLTAILGYTQLGMSKLSAESALAGHLQEIQKAAQRAADLTRQLLAFSRRQAIETAVLSLNDLVLATHKMLRRLIGENIELVTLPAQDLGMVRVDPGQIEQVLINLAVNARDAMPGRGKLVIETHNTVLDEHVSVLHPDVVPGQYVVLAVSDNGAGMTESVKSRIFEPYFTTKEQGKGTGLGMSTCYGIIKQSGGHIRLYSEVGEGTTFRIYFPRADAGTASGGYGDCVERLPRGAGVVLLVEDEETVRGMAARVLRQQGYTVLEAEHGGDALRLAEEAAGPVIDLLLTDIVMPHMGGRELADRLRARQVVSRVLYTSGYADESMFHHGRLEPGTEFMPKPFSPDTLLNRVREVMAER